MAPPSTASTALAVADVRKSFGATVAVDGVSFEVPAGSIFGLLGRNGAGKTTTLRMVAGIFYPDTGTVSAFGERWSPRSRDRIGYLPEERGLYRTMRVLDHLVFFAEIKGLERDRARDAAERELRRFELWDARERPVEELSKGNQQKVQLAGVLVSDPDLLLLDEPMSGLDPVNTVLVREVFQDLRRRGKTIVLSTHVMAEAERLCDRICLIHRGRVVLAGGVDEVRRSRGRESLRIELEELDGIALADLPGVDHASIDGRRAELLLAPSADTNRILARLLERTRIRRFEIASPSLEDVFVQAVGEAGEALPTAPEPAR